VKLSTSIPAVCHIIVAGFHAKIAKEQSQMRPLFLCYLASLREIFYKLSRSLSHNRRRVSRKDRKGAKPDAAFVSLLGSFFA